MRILFAGCTDYLTADFLSGAFSSCRFTVIGQGKKRSALPRTHYIDLADRDFASTARAAFATYEIDYAVYLSATLIPGGNSSDDLRQLPELVNVAASQPNTRLIYVHDRYSAEHQPRTSDRVVQQAIRDLIENSLAPNRRLILNTPWLYNFHAEDPFFNELLGKLDAGKKASLPFAENAPAAFLEVSELGSLLAALVNDWPVQAALRSMDVDSASMPDMGDFVNSLNQLVRGTAACGQVRTLPASEPENGGLLREKYGWFAHYKILDELPAIVRYYQLHAGNRHLLDRIRAWAEKIPAPILRGVELVLAALLTGLCVLLSRNQVQFTLVDYRLLFVVIIATMYGLRMGLASAALASVLLYLAYQAEGRNGMILFYEPSNWIAFIAYFAAGAACGIAKLKARELLAQQKKENQALADKLVFLHHIYDESLEEKRSYKKQILNSQDSFGKIFRVTQALNSIDRAKINIRAVQILQELLGNDSIGIYTVGKNRFARLEASASALQNKLPYSVRLDQYPQIIEKLEQNEVFVNTEMQPGYPAYTYGIYHQGELRVAIIIKDAEVEQMTLYFLNLFRLLCNMISNSLINALEYNQLVRSQRYIGDTMVLRRDAFSELVHNLDDAIRKHMYTGTLLTVNAAETECERISELLAPAVRENDYIGIGPGNRVYLLLSQLDAKDLPRVLERIARKTGWTAESITTEQFFTMEQQETEAVV